MKKILVLVIIVLSFYTCCKAQDDKSSVFKTREGNFIGELVVKLCSEDILEYKLKISKDAGPIIFEQKGYALIDDLEDQKKYGIDYEETIGTDANPIPVHQFMVTCDCEKTLIIKVAKDFSVIKLDYGDELFNEMLRNNNYSTVKGFYLGYFYRLN